MMKFSNLGTGTGGRRGQCRLINFLPPLLAVWALAAAPAQAAAGEPWWGEATARALEQGGTNRAELQKALDTAPPAHRPGLSFLLENMPATDRQTLTAPFLLENLALAYAAREEFAWGRTLPEDLFLNEVLPYASLNEKRDRWRQQLHDLCAPLVKNCRTPGEAAHTLNQKLFGLVKVKYSTQRRKANQNPLESMETGLASCTGLSILLVDACRSVAVPARVAGIPSWIDHRGNHTWVEIWDQGWHFAGAAEPDGNGLDRGWFVGSAAQALADDPQHSIYASSFKKTDLAFPMVWTRNSQVSAVNVTARYAAPAVKKEANGVQFHLKVVEAAAGRRVAARVAMAARDGTGARLEGMTRDESHDANDTLDFTLAKEKEYEIQVDYANRQIRKTYRSPAAGSDSLTIRLE
jgi:hypothetical protein